MFPVDSLIAWVYSIAFIGGVLYTHTLLYEPAWVQRNMLLKERWNDLNLSALFVALGASALTSYLYAGVDLAYLSFTTVIVGMITFCAVQTFDTDFAVRRADRFTLRYTMIATTVLGLGLFLLLGYAQEDMIGYIFFLCVGAAMYLLTFLGFGESDARAFTISITAVIVITGVLNLQYYFVLFLAFVLTYVGIQAIQRKSWKVAVGKVSIPAVPLFLFPAVLSLIAFPVLI